MKSIRYGRTSQSARRKSVSAILVFLLAAVAGPALWPPRVKAVGFMRGPSVRVTPNDRVEFRWSADVAWRAFVEVFDKNDGTGNLITRQESVDAGGIPVTSTDHTVTIDVLRLAPDTRFFFKVTMTDPAGGSLPLETQIPYPPFFTGAQAIGNVFVDAGVDRARIFWDANVIGTGRVDYGIHGNAMLSAQDQQNVTSHSIELTGLSPGTSYQFRVSNLHAIDGGTLAWTTGLFTTKPSGVSGFTGGPSVRVSPNTSFDIRWIADFVGDGKVEIFHDPNGGTLIDTKVTSASGNDHTLTFSIGGLLEVDRTYYFKVTHSDPTGGRADLTSLPQHGYMPVFTGAQAIGGVSVATGSNCGEINWNANVIGLGRVTYGTSSPDEPGPLDDYHNRTLHSLQLTNLPPNTPFQYRVATLHAIDGGILAETTGSFTTLPSGAGTVCPLGFTRGPSVRVTPNNKVEFRWSASASWRAFVEVFYSPDGSGLLITREESVDGTGAPVTSTDHTVTIPVLRLPPDTQLFFKITMTDPTGTHPLVTSTPLPSFFTGAQAIGDVVVTPGADSVRISWGANVVGHGRVTYGTSSPDELGPVDDYHHSLAHSVQLTGLAPGTTYQFRVSNRHAIDGGSLAEATGSFTTLHDTTPPNITSSVVGTLGNNGWYVSDVTVAWTVTEPESSVASQAGCDTQTVTADTGGVTFTCSATSEGGTSSQSVTVKRDATAPALNPIVTPNPVVLNGAATASPNATDALSGIASQSCDTVNTTIAGNHSVACIATDNAGNPANGNANYEVLSAYNFVGFFQPVDNLPTLNLATAGSAVPIKFSLTGYWGLSIFAAGYPASSPIQCDASDPGAVIEETVNAGGSSLNYNVSSDQYSYIWKTDKAWKGTCRMLVLKLNDNSQHVAKFKFR